MNNISREERGVWELWRYKSPKCTRKCIWKSHNKEGTKKRKSVKNKEATGREGDMCIRYLPS